MTESAKLLVFSEKPIVDIALLSGYRSQQAFTSAFTAMYKMPPNMYRENAEEATRAIFTGMEWLGLDWDEGPMKGGDCGPYFQSQRNDISKYKNTCGTIFTIYYGNLIDTFIFHKCPLLTNPDYIGDSQSFSQNRNSITVTAISYFTSFSIFCYLC